MRIRTVEVPNPEYDPPEDEEELEDYDVPKTIEVEQEYMVTVPEKDMAVVYARLHALLGKLMRTERQITLDIYGSIRVDERQ